MSASTPDNATNTATRTLRHAEEGRRGPSRVEDQPIESTSPSEDFEFPPLTTINTSASAKEAARILANFDKHPANPRNWSRKRKWTITGTVAVTGFISTCGSSIGVPGIPAAMKEFGETNEKIGILVVSFYVLGLGAGPFLFSPISELYGRQVAYMTSQLCYFLFSIGTATSQSMASLLVLRFFCGVFGSSGPALGVATCADLWAPSERGRPVSLYAIGPMAGPVLGSMIGYWILFGGWRWLLWTMAILSGLNFLLFTLVASETNAQVIEKKLKYQIQHPISTPRGLAEKLSPPRILHDLGWMSAMVSGDHAKDVFKQAFSRPARLLFTNPVCALFSTYYAYIYGIIYVFLVSVPLGFGSPPFSKEGLFSYEWPQATLSLSYLGLAVGFAMSATTAALAQDRIYKYLSNRSGGKGEPEYRLILTQTGMILMPIGLFITGWTLHAEVHWIGPQIGMGVVAIGLMLAFNSIQNFIVDAFFPYSAAGIASATALRSVTACILPIFTPDMYANLGWGWGNTLLACVAILGVPAPLLMFKYGKQLRDRYKFEG